MTMGYPSPDGCYFPLNDPSIPPEEMTKIFSLWVTGYYAHGDTPETLSTRNALDEPTPTATRMLPEEASLAIHEPPSLPGGSDTVILQSGLHNGVFSRLREAALFAPQNAELAWPNVEFRYVWCDQSVWMMPLSAWSFRAEMEQAGKDGKRIRTHSVVRMRGANHCVSTIPFAHILIASLIHNTIKAHWDQPEKTLRVLLSDAPFDVDIRNVARF
jgi:hypothetical protein